MTPDQPAQNETPPPADADGRLDPRGAVPADGHPTPADREDIPVEPEDSRSDIEESAADPSAHAQPAARDTDGTDGTEPGVGDDAGTRREEAPAYRDVTVRRAPKFVPFMMIGAILGFTAALVVAYTGPEDPTLTRESVLGFFTVALAIPGLLLAALMVLIFDRRSLKRAERARAERTFDDD